MIKVAISRCLLGESVRYDATHRKLPNLSTILNDNEFTIIPFCPEMAIGMGVPRAPIQLVQINTQIRAIGVNNPEVDVTDKLLSYAESFATAHPDLKAVINKKGSPSCGYLSTKCYQNNILISESASGVFLSYLKHTCQDLATLDELGCAEEGVLEEFLNTLHKKAR